MIFSHLAGDASALCGWLPANAGHVVACVQSRLTYLRVHFFTAEIILFLAYACYQWAIYVCDMFRPPHPDIVKLGKET